MTILFQVDGEPFTKEDMLAVNAEDAELCEWIEQAKPGDVFPAFVRCECVEVAA